jgi:hypothetical protein
MFTFKSGIFLITTEPSGSIKCCDFLLAELVFQEEICCVELVSYAYASI